MSSQFFYCICQNWLLYSCLYQKLGQGRVLHLIHFQNQKQLPRTVHISTKKQTNKQTTTGIFSKWGRRMEWCQVETH